jgi:hypothetical protein
MTSWHEQDDFWETVPLFEQERLEADVLLSLLGIEPSATVLDLCCGVGRHSWILILIRDGQRLEYTVGHRLYDGAGLRALLLDAGFESVALHGGLDGAPYDTSAQRLVAVARKAGA